MSDLLALPPLSAAPRLLPGAGDFERVLCGVRARRRTRLAMTSGAAACIVAAIAVAANFGVPGSVARHEIRPVTPVERPPFAPGDGESRPAAPDQASGGPARHGAEPSTSTSADPDPSAEPSAEPTEDPTAEPTPEVTLGPGDEPTTDPDPSWGEFREADAPVERTQLPYDASVPCTEPETWVAQYGWCTRDVSPAGSAPGVAVSLGHEMCRATGFADGRVDFPKIDELRLTVQIPNGDVVWGIGWLDDSETAAHSVAIPAGQCVRWSVDWTTSDFDGDALEPGDYWLTSALNGDVVGDGVVGDHWDNWIARDYTVG